MTQSKFKNTILYPEVKGITLAIAAIIILGLLYNYGWFIRQWLFTEEGHLYSTFFMLAVVISLAIKIYYRIKTLK